VARNELPKIRAERRYTKSEKLARTTLAGLEKALRPDDPRLFRAQSNYARLNASRTVALDAALARHCARWGSAPDLARY